MPEKWYGKALDINFFIFTFGLAKFLYEEIKGIFIFVKEITRLKGGKGLFRKNNFCFSFTKLFV
jgi:hypothetical protein